MGGGEGTSSASSRVTGRGEKHTWERSWSGGSIQQGEKEEGRGGWVGGRADPFYSAGGVVPSEPVTTKDPRGMGPVVWCGGADGLAWPRLLSLLCPPRFAAGQSLILACLARQHPTRGFCLILKGRKGIKWVPVFAPPVSRQ